MQTTNRWEQNDLRQWIILGFLLFSYFPQFYSFVGTDIGVYYEVARRMAEDGSLVLWGNYWDHKPPLIYLFFAPFTYVDRFFGDTYGLKIGTFIAYGSLSFGLYRALSAGSVSALDKNVAVLGVSVFTVIILGWLDLITNGILMNGAVALAFIGLLATIKEENKKEAFAAGILIAIAPFLRPTALTAVPVFLILLIVKYKNKEEKYQAYSALSGFVITMGICLTWLTSLGTKEVVETLIEFNSVYGAQARASTSIQAFFLQNTPGFSLAAILMIASCILLFHQRKNNFKYGVIIFIWAFIEIASIIFQRKLQPFYVFGFLLPILLTFIYLTINATKKVQALMSALLCGVLFYALYLNWTTLNKNIFENLLISQQDQKTFAIARAIAYEGCKGESPTLLVYGNRAQIYTHGSMLGVRPYKWTVFMNPIVDGGILEKRRDQLLENILTSPPSHIVYVGAEGWSPNIPGRIRLLEDILSKRYIQIGFPQTKGEEAPYNYTYRLYRLIECTLTDS